MPRFRYSSQTHTEFSMLLNLAISHMKNTISTISMTGNSSIPATIMYNVLRNFIIKPPNVISHNTNCIFREKKNKNSIKDVILR